MSILRIRCTPACIHIAIHGMRGRVSALVTITPSWRTGICRIKSSEVFEFPAEIKCLTFAGMSRGQTKRYQWEYIFYIHGYQFC